MERDVADEDLSRLKIDKTRAAPVKRRSRKWVVIAVACVVFLFIAIFWATGLFQPSVAVQVTTVSQVYPTQTFTVLNASGYVVAQRKSALASKVTGRLVWLGVTEGTKVKEGQVIARLESDDVKALRDQATANIAAARANLASAKAELADSTLNLNRSKALIDREFVARAEYDSAFARFQKAEAAVGAAEASVKAAAAALQNAEVSVEYTLIRVPFDAVVLTKNADIGDIVSPLSAAANAKAAVVTIADMSSLEVEADVSESNLQQVKVGQPCEIQLDALPDSRFRGEVRTIVPTADRSKATVLVKVGFLDKDPRILPEMSAKAAFFSRSATADEQKPRLAVAKAAVAAKNGKSDVFVILNNRAVQTPVKLGKEIGDQTEVLDGIKAGERVVLNPPARLNNHSRIKLVEK